MGRRGREPGRAVVALPHWAGASGFIPGARVCPIVPLLAAFFPGRVAGLHMLALINELLDISRIEFGAIDLRIARVDLAALAADVAETTGPLMAARRNTLRLTSADGLPQLAN